MLWDILCGGFPEQKVVLSTLDTLLLRKYPDLTVIYNTFSLHRVSSSLVWALLASSVKRICSIWLFFFDAFLHKFGFEDPIFRFGTRTLYIKWSDISTMFVWVYVCQIARYGLIFACFISFSRDHEKGKFFDFPPFLIKIIKKLTILGPDWRLFKKLNIQLYMISRCLLQ